MKKRIKLLIYAAAACLIFTASVSGGRISDYTYEGEENDVVVANRSAVKQVALTFDDGPCKRYTPEILDILNEYGIKATFFVVGKNAQQYPEIVLEEYNKGHEIGNHTYSHPNLRGLSAKRISDEITKTQEILSKITGKSPALFRPPGGYLNNDIVDCIGQSNCRPVLWSWRQDTKDWSNTPSEQIVNNILGNLKDGDIILFHDFHSGKSPTPDALRKLIPILINDGYSFVTVSELIETKSACP